MVIDNTGVIDDSDEPGDGALGFVHNVEAYKLDVDDAIDELEAEWDQPSEEPGPDWITFETFINDADNRNKLLAHGWKLTASRDGAAELVQEAVSRSLPTLGTGVRGVGAYIKYLKVTMTRVHITRLRKTLRAREAGDYGDGLTKTTGRGDAPVDLADDRAQLPSGLSDQEARIVLSEWRWAIRHAVSLLTPAQQAIVKLTFGLDPDKPFELLSQTEISEILGISVELVKSRRRQALVILRALLEDIWNDWKKS